MGTDGKLDQIDLKILSRLQADGRMHNNQLAEAVGLSASPCLQRVRRLERQGVISTTWRCWRWTSCVGMSTCWPR